MRSRIKDLDKRQGYKGAIKHFATKEEIDEFILEQRKRIMKESSTFFTYTTEGKNIYEFNEDEEALTNNLSYYDSEKEKINTRFKELVEIGNPKTDPLLQFLEAGQSYQAVVLEVDNAKKIILVSIGGSRAIIPETGFSWAMKGSSEIHHFTLRL